MSYEYMSGLGVMDPLISTYGLPSGPSASELTSILQARVHAARTATNASDFQAKYQALGSAIRNARNRLELGQGSEPHSSWNPFLATLNAADQYDYHVRGDFSLRGYVVGQGAVDDEAPDTSTTTTPSSTTKTSTTTPRRRDAPDRQPPAGDDEPQGQQTGLPLWARVLIVAGGGGVLGLVGLMWLLNKEERSVGRFDRRRHGRLG